MNEDIYLPVVIFEQMGKSSGALARTLNLLEMLRTHGEKTLVQQRYFYEVITHKEKLAFQYIATSIESIK